MTIKCRYWEYSFRECDVKGMTREELEDLAAEAGKMQYESNRVWLLVPGIGYGMEVR